MRNAQRGFTLIEIMVVVVILAVLGALVVPQILSKVDQARVTAAKTDIRTISGALDSYRLDNAPGGYLKTLPKDPWGNPYQYVTPGTDGRDYDITSYGRDGKPGGEGPDADISTATIDQK
jgi:general secretion pathway protein G